MKKIRKDYDDFKTLPSAEDLETALSLPPINELLLGFFCKLEELQNPEIVIQTLARLIKEILPYAQSGKYSPEKVEGIFRFACQIVRYQGLPCEEYCKRDDLYHLFFRTFYYFSAFKQDLQDSKFSEFQLIVESVIDPERVIQKFSAGYYDFRTEYVFIAKLFSDPRLSGYLLDALCFYESVPAEELIYDRETDIDNIIEGMGNPGWEFFVPIIEKYLYCEDDLIPMTAVYALGNVGGPEAVRALLRFRFKILEGFVELEPQAEVEIDLNIILAREGIEGVIKYVSGEEASLEEVRTAVHMLVGLDNPDVIRFFYDLIHRQRFKETSGKKVGFQSGKLPTYPLREEALIALENYDEKYVVSIVGDKYRIYRDLNFYKDLESFVQNLGLDKYLDDDAFES